jgi:ABC-2 type transport system permease protein
MRGIVQEKTDRVVEVLVSSVTPMELLTGKILGIAAVGLTQIFVWLTMIGLVGAYGAAGARGGHQPAAVRPPSVFVYFFLFFILAYLTYVCVYAIAGAVCNSEKEAQQFIMPIMMLMMMPWFLMMPIIMSPDAPFAVAVLARAGVRSDHHVRPYHRSPSRRCGIFAVLGRSLRSPTILLFFWITAEDLPQSASCRTASGPTIPSCGSGSRSRREVMIRDSARQNQGRGSNAGTQNAQRHL